MPYDMKGKKQLGRSAVASADAGLLWRILMDSKLLPKWAPVVHDVESCEANGESVGAVRQCRVELAGRAGKMVERCVDIVPERSISYLVDDESFGMRKMFADYGFRVSLEPLSPMETRVTIESFYTPRNAVYAFMNAVMMRPQFMGVVDQLISGLIALAESTGEASPAATPAVSRR